MFKKNVSNCIGALMAIALSSQSYGQQQPVATSTMIGGGVISPQVTVALIREGLNPRCVMRIVPSDGSSRQLYLLGWTDREGLMLDDPALVGASASGYRQVTLAGDGRQVRATISSFDGARGRSYASIPEGFTAKLLAAPDPTMTLTRAQPGAADQEWSLAAAAPSVLMNVAWQACVVGRNKMAALGYDAGFESALAGIITMLPASAPTVTGTAQQPTPPQAQQQQVAVAPPPASALPSASNNPSYQACIENTQQLYRGHDALIVQVSQACLANHPPLTTADLQESPRLKACLEDAQRTNPPGYMRDYTQGKCRTNFGGAGQAAVPPYAQAGRPVPPGTTINPELLVCLDRGEETAGRFGDARLGETHASCYRNYQPIPISSPIAANMKENTNLQPCLAEAQQLAIRALGQSLDRLRNAVRQQVAKENFCRKSYMPVRSDVDADGLTAEQRANIRALQGIVDDQRRREVCFGIWVDADPATRERIQRQYNCGN